MANKSLIFEQFPDTPAAPLRTSPSKMVEGNKAMGGGAGALEAWLPGWKGGGGGAREGVRVLAFHWAGGSASSR